MIYKNIISKQIDSYSKAVIGLVILNTSAIMATGVYIMGRYQKFPTFTFLVVSYYRYWPQSIFYWFQEGF